jgi:hypothetical protein
VHSQLIRWNTRIASSALAAAETGADALAPKSIFRIVVPAGSTSVARL